MTIDVLHILLMIAVVHLLALMSPGPDFILIFKTALQYGRQQAIYSAIGLGLGVTFHVTYCLLGFSLLIQHSPMIMSVIGCAGGCYLMFQGVTALKQAMQGRQSLDLSLPKTPLRSSLDRWQALHQGLLTNVLNPKAMVYFMSFFAATLTQLQTLMYELTAGIEVVILTIAWFVGIATMMAFPRCVSWFERNNAAINGVVGIAFMAYAAGIFWFAWSFR